MNMYDYILETPKIAEKLLEIRKESYKDAMDVLASEEYNEIVFIGSGSSYNASFTAKYLVENLLNIPVTCKYPYLVKNFEKQINEKAIYIFVSQSGESRLTYEVIDIIKKKGCKVITLTSNLESSISKGGDISIDMNCGQEVVPYKTKGYTCTYMSIIIMALEVAYKKKIIKESVYDEYVGKLYSIVDNMNNIIKGSELWYQENYKEMMNADSVLVIGTGTNYGTAIEAHLKVIETVRCFTFVYELEEYMHGPQNALSNRNIVFGINSGGVEDVKIKGLFKFLKSKISNAYLIGKDGDTNFKFVADEVLSPLELTLFFQVIAYKYSQSKNVDLSKKAFDDFDKIVGKKVKN